MRDHVAHLECAKDFGVTDHRRRTADRRRRHGLDRQPDRDRSARPRHRRSLQRADPLHKNGVWAQGRDPALRPQEVSCSYPGRSAAWSEAKRCTAEPGSRSSANSERASEPDKILDRRQKRLRLLQRRAMAAARQFDVTRAGDLVRDRLVERRRRGLVELAAHHQRRHAHAMQQRLEVGLLQNLAGGLERLVGRSPAALSCAPRSPPDARRDRPAKTPAWRRSRRSSPSPPRRPSPPSPRRPCGPRAENRRRHR